MEKFEHDPAWTTAINEVQNKIDQITTHISKLLSATELRPEELNDLQWAITVLSGLLEAELARREGTVDMAGEGK